MATAATTFFSQEQACQQLHMHFNPCDTKEAMDATCKTHGLKHSYTKTRVSSSACALYKLGSALECLCFTQTRVLPQVQSTLARVLLGRPLRVWRCTSTWSEVLCGHSCCSIMISYSCSKVCSKTVFSKTFLQSALVSPPNL